MRPHIPSAISGLLFSVLGTYLVLGPALQVDATAVDLKHESDPGGERVESPRAERGGAGSSLESEADGGGSERGWHELNGIPRLRVLLPAASEATDAVELDRFPPEAVLGIPQSEDR